MRRRAVHVWRCRGYDGQSRTHGNGGLNIQSGRREAEKLIALALAQ